VSRSIAFNHDNFGDPFMTSVSPSVRVRLRTDRPLVVAASGHRVAGDERDGTYEAADVRDFTFIMAEDYRVTTGSVDGIEVRVLTRPGGLSGDAMAALASRALAGYAAHLGPYPYPTLTIAESVAGYGLESPALVWIPRATSAANLRYLVPHEVAHQWFYALVSNDQANEPFADEAVADIMARDLMGMLRSPRCASDRLDRSIYDYTRACYFETVYVRGSLVLDRARDAMGNDAFWAALRGYLDAHRFGFGSTRELLEALDAATPADLRAIFEPLLPSAY
jgi:aminopeptidase N